MLDIKTLNILAIKMAQGTYTSIEFFLRMPVKDMIEYWKLIQEMNESEKGGR